MEEFCLNGKPTVGHCIGNQPSFRSNGMAYTVQLEENLFLHTHSSTKDRRKAIQNFADEMGISVEFCWGK